MSDQPRPWTAQHDHDRGWHDKCPSCWAARLAEAAPLASETTDAGLRDLAGNRQVPDANRITITVGELRAALSSSGSIGQGQAIGQGYGGPSGSIDAEPVLDESLGRVRVYGYGLIDIGDALAFAKLHGWRLSESVE